MIRLLLPFITLITGLWVWSLLSSDGLGWSVYEHSLYLSGLLAISLMSLTTLLAFRPAWLASLLGGRGQVFLAHKWAGILTGVFAVFHWLVEMGDDLFESVFGKSDTHAQDYSGFVDMMRDAAEAVGEFTVYLLFAMLLVSLARKYFPYKFWRLLHRVMPVLYLLLVFHGVWLTPVEWWLQPLGFALAALLIGGSITSLLSISGRISLASKSKPTSKPNSTQANHIQAS